MMSYNKLKTIDFTMATANRNEEPLIHVQKVKEFLESLIQRGQRVQEM